MLLWDHGENVFNWKDQGDDFAIIQDKLASYRLVIHLLSSMVDDLDHLVKGGRLSNGAAILGNLLSIKPILYFNDQGVIECTKKFVLKRKQPSA